MAGLGVKMHVVAVLEATGQLKLYRDGVLLAQTSTVNNTGGSYIAPVASIIPMRLFGMRYDTFDRQWHGVAWKVALYDKPVTLAEVEEMYAYTVANEDIAV